MYRINRVTIASIIFLVIAGLTYYMGYSQAAADVPEPFADPHGNYLLSTAKCAKCHSGHTAGAQGVARRNSQRETCYACHDGSNASPDIRHQFGENSIGSSVYSSYHPVPKGIQLCTNCHDPHLATDASPGGQASLLAVGPSKVSSGNAVCGYCHGPGSTAPGGDLLTSFTGTAHDISMTNPASGTQIKCSRCHRPHGSSIKPLIRNSVVSQTGGVYDVTGNDNTLCFGCHTNLFGQYSGKSLYQQVKHGVSTGSSTVAKTVYPGTSYQKAMCLNCHEPHGKQGFPDYRRASGNSLCYGCHIDSMIPAQYSYRGTTAYNNTPHVNATVYNLSYPAGDCLNCHAVHGKDSGTGTAIPKQLRLAKPDVCFGGGAGACHSSSNNSDRKIDIKNRFTVNSNILTHHSVNPAEYSAGGNSKLECGNCHDPHLNTAAGKLVDPQNRFTAYTVYNDVSKYIGSGGEMYFLVKAKHDGKAPVITVNPTTTNTETSCTIDWWTDEPSTSRVYYGSSPDSLGSFVDGGPELVTHHIVTVEGLNPGSNYWFKVRSTDAVNNYGESNAYQMDQVDPVILAAPAVVSSTGTSVTITWNTNETSNSWIYYTSTVDYAVYGDFSHGQQVQANPVQWSTSHSVTLTGLIPGTTYRYKAYSADYRGRATESLAPGTFSATNPPNPPVLNELADHTDTSTTNYSPHLTWQAGTDPDGDTITGYYVQISRYPEFWDWGPQYTQSSGWITSLEWTPPTPISNNDTVFYYWRVKSKDSNNAESAWGVPPGDKGFYHTGTPTPPPPPPPTWSCPNIYVWDGQKYKFVTDLTGGGLSIKVTTKRYKDVYPDLPVTIPWNLLQEKDGKYSIKLKNDREEVDYHDYVGLTAVDHPVGTRVALNDLERDKKTPKIYTYRTNLKPIKKATYFNNHDYSGGPPERADITELVSKEDGRDARGMWGDDNQFTFDLGDMSGAEKIKLVLTGWTEYRNPQEAKAFSGKEDKMARTYYEILQPDGTWKRTPIQHFNGLGKTVILDLTNKFPKDAKQYVVRFRGMLRPRFDRVAVDTTADEKYTTRDAELLNADLEYKGPANETKDKKSFDYYTLNTTYDHLHEGKFTRFGDVLPLLNQVDDKLVVMDTGDEVSLTFKALPPPAPGMTRSFIFKPYAYYKDDLPFVQPMPFRKMNIQSMSLGKYPEELKSYIEEWNTRQHHAGEKPMDTLDRIKVLFTDIGDYINTAWNNTFRSSAREESNRDRTTGADRGNSPLKYELYKNSPWTGFRADKGHYSLNTDHVVLSTDTLKEVKKFSSDSAGFEMWESGGDNPPTPTSGGTDRTTWAGKVINDDTELWTTDYFPSTSSHDGAFNYQMFKFVNTVPVKDLSSFAFYWWGKGEPSLGYDVYISLWNFQTNSWDEVKHQLVGQENAMSIEKYVDYNTYCYKCHAGTVPSGVQLGTINSQPIKNISTSYPADKHGGNNSGKQGYTTGLMKLPYARGHASLPCADCHDLHGSQNVYHLRENPNGVTVGAVPPNTSTATNNQVEAWCQGCHQGDRESYHRNCLSCHRGINQGHRGWYNSAILPGDFSRTCLSCHQHGGSMYTHSACHCGLDNAQKAF